MEPGWGIGANDVPPEVLSLREKLAAKDTTIASYETRLLRKSDELDELRKSYDDAINKLRGETERNLALERELRQTADDLRAEKNNVQNLEAALNNAQQVSKTATMSSRELEATLETLSHESTKHQERCKTLEREKGKLEERVREMTSLLSQSSTSNATSKRKQSHRPRSSSLSNFKISNLETDISDTRLTLQQRERELETLSKKLSAAQAEANKLSNEKNALEKKTTAHIAELQSLLEEREEELAYLRGTEAGGSREEELEARIEEDAAKIAALEAMVRRSRGVEEVESKLRETEAHLQEEIRRTRKLTEQQLHVKEENDNLILELNDLRSQLRSLELTAKGRSGRPSLLSHLDADMDDAPETPPNEEETGPLPDEDVVEYTERLLAAIDRLRDERDTLRRNMSFLESESQFTIEALEKQIKLSRSMATTTSDGDDTLRTMNQMKMEMDALHSHVEDLRAASDIALRRKDEEIGRLGRAAVALGVVLSHSVQYDGETSTGESGAKLEELEGEIEAVLAERDALVDLIRKKEMAWDEELQELRLNQQQAHRNIQDLHSEIDELTKINEAMDSERGSLAIQVQNLEADLENAQKELADAEGRYSDLQFHQLSSMSSTEATQNLRKQITALEQRIDRRNEQLGIHQHDIRRLETNLRLQEERLNELTSELEMMSAEKEAMVEDCADAREVRDEALRRVEEMEELNENLEAAVEDGDGTIVTLIGVIFDAVSKARRGAQKVSGTSSRDDLNDALDAVDELKECNEHLEATVQKYSERINQLTAQIVNLQGQHDSTALQAESSKKELESRITALHNDIDALQSEREELERSHSAEMKEMEDELDRLRQRLAYAEERITETNANADDGHQADISRLEERLAELQATLSEAEAQHAGQVEELHHELQSLSEAKLRAEDEVAALQDQLALAESEHERASGVLQEELSRERHNLKQAQLSFDSLEDDRQKLVDDLHALQEALKTTQDELATTKEQSSKAAQHRNQEVEALAAQIHELSARVQQEQTQRQGEAAKHEETVLSLKEQHDAAVLDLQRDLELLRADYDRTDQARMAAEAERNGAQEQVTDLVAKVEQSKSLYRSFETQIAERERTISALKDELEAIQVRLNAAEQASAKATLSVSLMTAQHKRELADAQRELDRLRSNSNLELVTAELEERNQEMEQLLKQKCAEIEENDDRTLEMLKENKKLASKVDSLTRKVQALQAKVSTLKANSPKAEAKVSTAPKPSPLSGPSTSRPRAATLTSSQQPTHPAVQTQRPSMPSTSSSRPLTRVSSGPSAPLRSKTPERSRSQPQGFRNKTPEDPTASTRTSPVGETESVAGRKRRAPDDFEVCDSMPPQAFIAESVPISDTENRTPRVRRVLSTLQSGFTPVRNFARPVAPLPSPRRNPIPTASQSPFMAENSPMNVIPPLSFAPPSGGKSSNKRSWLGKIRGAGTSSGAIVIHGGPGVEVKVNTPGSVGVKFLAFSPASKKLVCIDVNNQLHVWDLTTFGAPEYLASARFDQVNSIQCPPSSCHLFVGLESGEIKTYDLACLRKSQYAIPNLWKLYESTLRERGIPSLVDTLSFSQPCLDQILHPRDLNQIFVGYADGVILSDITDRSTVRAYELILPPGAPGGSNYGAGELLTHRRPAVTCLAVHPSGHFFAVGHADGCIAFWAVEDDTNPLTVFTFDEDNVHLVDNDRLEAQLENQGNRPQAVSLREPIIKMAWSGYPNSADPRGGETTLTILGGLDPTRGGDVTVLWFPAFNPAEPPAGSEKVENGVLHPFFRSAMVESLTPIDLAEYDLEDEIQDFLLIPKDNPHYSGAFDPYAILFLTGTVTNERVVSAKSFPPSRTLPSGNSAPVRQPSSALSPVDNPKEQSTLLPYRSLALPFHLGSGSTGLVGGRLLTVENTSFERIVETGKVEESTVILTGGKAFADQTKQDEIRLTKYQPRRVLITYNRSLDVCIFDVSAQSLVAGDGECLKSHFPDLLPGLSIELKCVWDELVSRGKRAGPEPTIQTAYLASEALELASVLDNGDVVVHRSHPPSGSSTGIQSNELILLYSASTASDSRMHPYFVLQGEAKVEACSISDIGFMAVSYSSGSFVVVDMRGPSIIYRDTGEAPRGKHRLSVNPLNLHGQADTVRSLAWTISSVENDETLRVRLVVLRHSGSAEVLTLKQSGSPATWSVSSDPIRFRGVSEPLRDGTFVLDSKTGKNRGATGSLFASSYHSEACPTPSLLIAAGEKGARTYADITGERIGKADWGLRGGSAVTAQIVGRMGSRALVVVTDKEEVLAYSLPHLEQITRFKLLPLEKGDMSIDQGGDFVSFCPSLSSKRINQVVYGTFFDIRRSYGYPEVDLGLQSCRIPQPQPVYMGPPSLVGSWFHFGQTMSGERLDNLLGGPDRPLPQTQQRPGLTPTGSSYGTGIASAASGIAASAASAQTSLYNRMSSALSERGQLLGGLEESFNSLEQGSRSMAAQAKKLAAQQTAKSWFGF